MAHSTSSGGVGWRAEAAELIRAALALPLSDANRPIRLRLAPSFGAASAGGPRSTPAAAAFATARFAPLGGLLLVQRAEIHEAVFEGLTARLTCLSAVAALPLADFIGLPIEVQLVTDRGALRRFCALVTEAQAGESDGGLAVFQLTARDALAVMARGSNSRVFRQKSAVDITHLMLREWLHRSTVLAHAFDFDLSRLTLDRYPAREFTMQHNESDAAFLRRTWRRAGIGWVVQPGAATEVTPRHRLILFDDAMRLDANAAGDIRYHRDAATEPRDGITQWAPVRRLVPGRTVRQSWDYRAARMQPADERSRLDQGASGDALAAALNDSAIEMPHAGDSADDHRQLARLRRLRHEADGGCVHGLSGVRDLAAGEWNTVSGHVTLEGLPAEQREYLVTEVWHLAENNLPKRLDERARALLAGSAGLPGWHGAESAADGWADGSADRAHDRSRDAVGGHGGGAGIHGGIHGGTAGGVGGGARDGAFDSAQRTNRGADSFSGTDRRYLNRFTAVPRDQPLVPRWHPREHLPPTPPMTAIVVGPAGHSVCCDALGRVKVQFQGLDPEDHQHAQGAGTEGSDRDSAWLRVDFGWAGAGFGNLQPLRVGMEVLVQFLGGDPDRPVITGVLYNARQVPPAFSHRGGLPSNGYLSGTHTREIRGQRYNQLRFDDTPGQISAQLASEHGDSQLNLGFLTHPRQGGEGEPRGEGFELRSDDSGALRAAKGLLISAWRRLNASGTQGSAEEHLALMQDCIELFKSLGQYAAEHGALPADIAPQAALQAGVKGPGGGAPAISVTAPEGLALTTPKTILSYAGLNIDSVAMQHLQLASGARFTLNAGTGASLFAHQGGITTIAHHGKLLMQSQHDDTQLDSAGDIKLSAGGGRLIGVANDEIVFTVAGVAYLKLKGGDIEIGGPGAARIKTASHEWAGPASGSVDLPKFGDAQLGRVPQLIRPTDGQPVEGMKVRIRRADGSEVSGTTDAQGKGPPVDADGLEQLAIRFLVKRT